ncbi:MAG: AMP-binding protein, partial [Nitrososphaerales archaeon]
CSIYFESPSKKLRELITQDQELVWTPSRESIGLTKVKGFMDIEGIGSYEELVRKSTDDISWWWSSCEKQIGLEWFQQYSTTVDTSLGKERASWFLGGSINLTHNAVDKFAKSMGGSIAFIWLGEDGTKQVRTYHELARETNMFSNYLKGIGIKKGDVVASCIPMSPEVLVCMFAATKIGAVFSPIFCGYGPTAIASRLSDANAKLLLTCDGYLRRGKRIELKPAIDEALQISRGSSKGLSTKTLVVERLGNEVQLKKDRGYYYKQVKSESSKCEPEHMMPDDPAMLLYTSGTTGKPKGAVISQIGAMIQPAKEMEFNLDVRKNDVFMWMSDIGWMMGPWQVIGAQLMGATHIIFEGVPDYPDPDRIWKMIEEYHITHLGHSATTMRSLKKYGEGVLRNHNLDSLRVLGNTGEPIDQDTWMWEMKFVGNWECPLINLSGGTEIFGSFLLPSPIVSLKPSTLWGPGLGMDVDVFDDSGNSIRGQVGYLVCKKPAPSMTRGFWNDFKRYRETYWTRFPGVWYHGDWAYVDQDGFWFLHGRADDVIKVAGRRVGPAEIESILNSLPQIAESATVGLPDDLKGERLYCFVQLKPGFDEDVQLIESAKKRISQSLGKTLEPDKIIVVKDLPRTRSGKIMRKLIRTVILSEDSTVDMTAVENPDSIQEIRSSWKKSVRGSE